MMKFRAAVLCLAVIPLVLGGCKTLRGASSCNKKQSYQSASSVAPLTIPAGLTGVDASTALKLPPLNEPAAPPRTSRDPCLDAPPAYKVAKPAPPPQA
jgi:uncharacterized lipoprotein